MSAKFRVRQQSSSPRKWLRANSDEVDWVGRNEATSFASQKAVEEFVAHVIARYPTMSLVVEKYGT